MANQFSIDVDQSNDGIKVVSVPKTWLEGGNTPNWITPVVNYGMTSGGILIPQRVDSEGRPEMTQYGSIVADTKSLVNIPHGFSWHDNPLKDKIYKNSAGYFEVDFDISKYEITGKTYYVDNVNGNNSNDGLTKETAFKTLDTALSQPDVDVVKIAGGFYNRREVTYNNNITRSCTIKPYEGERVILSAHEPSFSWSLEPGYTNVNSANNSYVSVLSDIRDTKNINKFGDYVRMIERSSIQEVEDNPNSFYIDRDNNMVYIHTFDSREVSDDEIRCFVAVDTLKIHGFEVYIERIDFEGGRYLLDVKNGGKLYLKDCTVKYASKEAGVRVENAALCYSQNVVAAENHNDGFNYHDYEGIGTKFIEINCVGRNNGLESGTDNGSSAHDGITGIRVNGSYFGNKGPNIADVGDDTETWNLGCHCFNSETNIDYDFYDNVMIWLDSCVAYGSTTSLRLRDGIVNTKQCIFNEAKDITSGSLNEY